MSDYDEDINQSAARPGMEGVANRQAPAAPAAAKKEPLRQVPYDPEPIMQSRDQDGNETQGARPQVARGRTDPFSIKGSPAPPKAPPAPSAPAAPSSPGSGKVGRQRTQAIEDEADKAG